MILVDSKYSTDGAVKEGTIFRDIRLLFIEAKLYPIIFSFFLPNFMSNDKPIEAKKLISMLTFFSSSYTFVDSMFNKSVEKLATLSKPASKSSAIPIISPIVHKETPNRIPS